MNEHAGTGRTLARAFGFLIGHIADVIGLGWLAAVFYGATIYVLIQRLAATLLIAPPATPLLNQFTAPYFLGALLATALFGAVMAIALTRSAAGRLESRAGVYFLFGLKEVRLFLALVKFYAIALVVTVAAGYLAMQGALAIAAQIPPSQVWLNMPPSFWLLLAAALVAFGMFVFLEARLGFFLAPLAANEERPLLRYSWRLSRRNSLATIVASSVFPIVVFAILGAGYFLFANSGFNATLILQRGDPATWHALQANAGVIAAILAITLTVLNALFAGASAHVYSVVEVSLQRIGEGSTQDYAGRHEPAYAMANAPVAEPFVAAPEEHHAAPEAGAALNVISEPVAAAELPEPETLVVESATGEAEATLPPEEPAAHHAGDDVVASIKAEIASATGHGEEETAIPPPSFSEVLPVSQQTAPSEAV